MPRETISRTTDQELAEWREREYPWTDHKGNKRNEPAPLALINKLMEKALVDGEAWAIERALDLLIGRAPHRMEGAAGAAIPAGLMYWMNEATLTGEQGMPKKNGNGARKANGSKKSARAAT